MSYSFYHTYEIPKGVYGELSKVKEEILELIDGEKQDNQILIRCELSDIYGAYEEYLKQSLISTTIEEMILKIKPFDIEKFEHKKLNGETLMRYYEAIEKSDIWNKNKLENKLKVEIESYLEDCVNFSFVLCKIAMKYGLLPRHLKIFSDQTKKCKIKHQIKELKIKYM